MAAQSLVRRSYALPVETYATNVMGTIHLLEAARQCPSLRAIVVVTSDKCYVNREWLWPYREDEALGGHDPYSSSKACVEILTESWRSSFLNGNECNVAVASSRAGNVIGGGDWADERLIPDCVRAFTAGRSVELRNPGAVRPWQHVLDPLVGYLTLAQALLDNPAEAAQAWNFGPFETDTDRVANVVDQFARLWGGSARWCVNSDTQPHEASILRLDATKARERLGWRPRLNLATAIAWTAEWYREWASGKLAGNLCSDQIERYLSMDQQ